MSETTNTPSGSQLQTSQPDVPVDGSGTTGNPADAAPTQSNPTDSSSVSDEQGVQSAQTSSEVDHEGTGAGTDTPSESNYSETDEQ